MTKHNSHTEIFVVGDESNAYDLADGEKNLLLAILQTAAADLKRGNHLSNRAVEFFLSQEDDYVFSFRSICEYLKVDPSHVLKVVGLLPKSVPQAAGPAWNNPDELEVAFEKLRNRL